MGLFLKQSTAVTLQIGPFVDSGDGDTDEDGFTLEDSDILLSKNGGVFNAKNEASDCTYDTAGYYRCPIDGTDTNTLGRLQLDVHVAGALHVYHEFTVVTANVYDTLCGADAFDVELNAAGVDSIWDELMAGHVTPDSAAYVMRSLTSLISDINQAQAGAAGSITLANTSSIVNDYYKGQTICIVLGAGAGQARACYAYNGGTNVASIRPNWATAPDNTSYYAILNVGSSVVAAIEDIDFSATMLTSLDAATPSVTVSDKTGFSLSAAGVDAILDEVVDTNAPANANSLRETVNVIAGVVAGKSSGGGTATHKFQDLGDTKARQTATVDADGNRTAVTVDGT